MGARTPYRQAVDTAVASRATMPGGAPPSRRYALALGAWGVALAVVVVLGRGLTARGQLHLGAAPLSGTPRNALPWTGLLLPAATAAVLVAAGPWVAARLRPATLPWVTAAAAAAWAVALALVDGPAGLTAPLIGPHDYLADLGRVHGVSAFLGSFSDLVVRRAGVDVWTTHVAGHPPGALLMFWAADRVGLGGPGWGAALLIGVGSSAAAAAVVAVRALGGPGAAVAAAPLLALAPYALWVATSADAAFLGVSAWGLALLALAVTRPPGRATTAAAFSGGILLGAGLYLSYGLAPFGAVAVAVLASPARRRAVQTTAVAAAGVLLVVLVYTRAGFWWPDGYTATRTRWAQGWGSARPILYSELANLAVAGLAVGPAAVAALTRLRALPGRSVRLVVGALLALLLAEASGMSRGEVERIWLPFLPWLLIAAVVHARGGAVPRRWLLAQAGCTLAVTALVRTAW